MHVQYHVERLEQILRDLSVLTGIAIAFLDADGNTVCNGNNENNYCEAIHRLETGGARCYRSDMAILERCRQSLAFESHICYAGLYDAAMPVVKDGVIVGFVIMGRVRRACSEGAAQEPSDERLRALYRRVPVFTDAQINSLRTLLPTILFESAIELDVDARSLINEATDHIKRHLGDDVSISTLCAELHVSKNQLYRAFHAHYHCTVNEYVSRLRLKKAKERLAQSGEAVYLIAEQVGVHNYTYFCKWFKKSTGYSPTEYRRNANK